MAKWTKGQSGNPKGRPKSGSSIAQLLREKVNKTRFVEALLDAAYGGDVRAIGLVLAYTDGLPIRQGDNGRFLQGIKIEVNYVDRERIERLAVEPSQAAFGTGEGDRGIAPLQRRLLRPSLGQVNPGDRPDCSPGVDGTTGGVVQPDVPDAD
jgi:uncharacterized protein DUF5681